MEYVLYLKSNLKNDSDVTEKSIAVSYGFTMIILAIINNFFPFFFNILISPCVFEIEFNSYICEFVIKFSMIMRDRKSTRLNSSHVAISYAVFCLKKKII